MDSAAQLVAAEIAVDAARIEDRRRDLIRHRGVNWSGLGPDPLTPRASAELQAAAEARLKVRRSWSASSQGQLISAIAACQAAAHRAHAVGEQARAGVARGEPAEWRRQMLGRLDDEIRALASGLAQARAAIDAPDAST